MRLRLLAMLTLFASCEGSIFPGGVSINTPPPPPPDLTPPDVSCDLSKYPGVQLAAIASDFATNVYPAMQRTDDGCVSCHAPGLGRNFLVTPDGTETFYKAEQAGYFDAKPSTIVDRLTSKDPIAHMPNNGKIWPHLDVEAAGRVACQVQAYQAQGGAPADEVFPPDLLMPYAGAPNTDYDNSFINYLQLKAKVHAIFADDWIRGADGGADQFLVNINAFGGADYVQHFTEQQTVTADFLLGLDKLVPDICGAAATNGTGPFAGLNLTAPITDIASSQMQAFEAEAATADGGFSALGENGQTSGFGSVSGTSYFCYTNCVFATAITLPSQGSYQFLVRAKGADSADAGPKIEVKIDGTSLGVLEFADESQFVDQTITATVPAGGSHAISWTYINDYNNPPPDGTHDRNVWLDRFQVVGPSGGGGMQNQTAARAQLNTLYQRLLYRDATTSELDDAYSLLSDLNAITTPKDAWGGVCEALVRHPDFLFTVPPSVDTMTGVPRQKLLLVKLGLDLLGRPPTGAELTQLGSGATFAQMVDAYLASPEFKTYYFSRARQRTESQGTDVADEPARLWTYLAVNDKPFFDLFVADYSIDPGWQVATRTPEHGKSGMLTMQGYIQGKPGLPHFNYAARVMTGFMGRVFEVPPEVFAQRATATATSTVDPTSICFNCHQVLTPLTMQRTGWDDNGNYQTVDSLGQTIDDTDRGLVPTYPFKGKGMEAFATQAVKKEAFVLSMLQSQFRMMMGRNMRADADERVLFKTLWDETQATNGNLKKVLKTITLDKAYQRTP